MWGQNSTSCTTRIFEPQPRLQTGQHKQSNSHDPSQECSCWFVCDVFRGQVRAHRLCLPAAHRGTAPWSQLCLSIVTIACLLAVIRFSGAQWQLSRDADPRWGKADFSQPAPIHTHPPLPPADNQNTNNNDNQKHLVLFLHAATFEFRV